MDFTLRKKVYPGSFRDPSGHIVILNDKVQRIINPSYFTTFELFEKRHGLYDALSKQNLLVRHKVIEKSAAQICIEPVQIPFISYPFEWSFHQLKDAALVTLQVAKVALSYDMYLKDASAFNVQFRNGKPIFIDTLSFEQYVPGKPWSAYGQFVQNFLGPLLLMSYIDCSLGKLSANYIDGVPLNMISKMLPKRTWFKPSIYLNVHAHAKKYKQYQDRIERSNSQQMSKIQLEHLLSYLELTVTKLESNQNSSEWSHYYSKKNYSSNAFEEKHSVISSWVKSIHAKRIWDAGSNNGHFSRALIDKNIEFINTDIDPIAVDKNYLINTEKNIKKILPLAIDLTNPTPGVGFNNIERDRFTGRMQNYNPDCILALALIHHLCLSHNCSFEMVLSYFSNLSPNLILEFVPPEDSWAKVLLNQKRDFKHLFSFYNQAEFEEACLNYFNIESRCKLNDSERTLYFLKRK